MRDLALQSANDTNTDKDRAAMQKEIVALKAEVTRIHDTTNFAGIKLLNKNETKSFQVGSNANETISIDLKDLSTGNLGINKATAAADYAVSTTAAQKVKVNGTEITIAKNAELDDAIKTLNAKEE